MILRESRRKTRDHPGWMDKGEVPGKTLMRDEQAKRPGSKRKSGKTALKKDSGGKGARFLKGYRSRARPLKRIRRQTAGAPGATRKKDIDV
jgi:hypothetical protein